MAPERLAAAGTAQPPQADRPRAPRRRRGALRQPVGPRLPPRLPADRRAPPRRRRRPDRGADRHRRRRDPRRDRRRGSSPARAPATFLRGFDRPNLVARLRAQGQPAPAGPRLRRRAPRAAPASSTAPAAPAPRRSAAALGEAGHTALAYHAGLAGRRPPPRRDPLPARGRARRLRDDRLRHGRRQARHPLRRPRRPAEVDRGLLPGDRPRRPRRGAGRHPDALRARRHPAAARRRSTRAPRRWSASRPTTSG